MTNAHRSPFGAMRVVSWLCAWTAAATAVSAGASGGTPDASVTFEATEDASKPDASRGAQRRAYPLPPIRRLGIDPVEHNLNEYRTLMSREGVGAEGTGLAALPYTPEQLENRLSEIVERAAGASGRYFVVSSAMSGRGTGASALGDGTRGAQKAARDRLRRSFDLDGWLQTRVSFEPDTTRLHVTIKGAGGPGAPELGGRVLAREDVLLSPDATEKDVYEGLLGALGRLGRTLGHDGRVTSLREDLVTLDFGSERGLAPGSRVELGLVVLGAFHPVSGEFLRHSAVATHVAEVIDAREGSAIARIVKRNRTTLREAAGLFAHGREDDLALLAWREGRAPMLALSGKDPWVSPREVQVLPLTGVADEGFGDARKKETGPRSDGGFFASLFADAPARKDPTKADDRKQRESAPGANDADGAEAENLSDKGDRDDVLEEGEDDAQQGDLEHSARHRPRDSDRFRLLSAHAGIGITFGRLSTDRGDRYTDFPSTVFNTLLAGAHLALPGGLESDPEIALRLFSGGDAEGTEFAIKAPVLAPVARFGAEGRFLAGGELHVNSGSVKTIRVKKDLGEFAILGVGALEKSFAGVGEGTLSAGVSVFGLLGGHIDGFLRVGLAPSRFVPKPLAFWARASAGPEDWSAFDIGATWSFLEQAR